VNRVLVVGMLDSVHLARWLKQFKNSEVEIVVFPSARFKKIHPEIGSMLRNKEITLYKKLQNPKSRFFGYRDFIEFEISNSVFKIPRRASALKNFLEKSSPDIVHLIEIQHAGYLFLDANPQNRTFTVITTNYGSDIYYFGGLPEHNIKISQVLKLSDFYSAECRRDYALAKEMGFTGTELPLMPNAGGFDIDLLEKQKKLFGDRSLIYVKGYGGIFGLGGIALAATSRILDTFPGVDVVVVSLTKDLAREARSLKKIYGERIKFYRIGSSISRAEVLNFLSISKVCIGASRSDGISTTFLEALVSGAIPVQTNTSCANEWTEKGFFAKIVRPSVDEIFQATSEILMDPTTFELKSQSNMKLAKEHLNSVKLSSVAQTFYQGNCSP